VPESEALSGTKDVCERIIEKTAGLKRKRDTSIKEKTPIKKIFFPSADTAEAKRSSVCPKGHVLRQQPLDHQKFKDESGTPCR
jgi:hypothetical protein